MADKTRITVSERFVSQDEAERRENVQRAMDEYAALSEGGGVSGREPERE